MSGFTVVLDACVLYPAPLRDLLLSIATAGIYRAKWSQQIHDEWTRNLLANRPDLDPMRLKATCTRMNTSVPDSLVTGYEDLIKSLQLDDPDDRHVLAVAIRTDADVIVTFNQKDFDEHELNKYGVYTEHPDEVVHNMINTHTPKLLSAVREMRIRLRKPAKTVQEYLDTLYSQGLPQTVSKLAEYGDAI
ncbi:MAG TPA: PIN domain-containing protein [Pirellula sp.]|nr:PIN domain-containing protein [Pirellula sp.]